MPIQANARPAAAGETAVLTALGQRRDASGQPWIGPAAQLAGERLAADMLFAGLTPKVTMDWSRGAPRDRGGGGHGLNASEAAIAAQQRARQALAAVGPELAGLLIDVCGFDKGLETLERERNWPVRSAKVAVRIALDALARHYGYSDAAAGGAGARPRAWTAPGPRASMDARRAGRSG